MTTGHTDKEIQIANTRTFSCFLAYGNMQEAINCGMKVLTSKEGLLEGVEVHSAEMQMVDPELNEEGVFGFHWDFSHPSLRPLKEELWKGAIELADTTCKKIFGVGGKNIRDLQARFFEELQVISSKNIVYPETMDGYVKNLCEMFNISPTSEVTTELKRRITKMTEEYRKAS